MLRYAEDKAVKLQTSAAGAVFVTLGIGFFHAENGLKYIICLLGSGKKKIVGLSEMEQPAFWPQNIIPDVALELRNETPNGKKSATYTRNA